MPSSPPTPRLVEARTRVIYGDTDQMGVVYYANYLRYFELARSEFFRALGGSYVELERQGYGLPVVEAGARYRVPARYDDVIVIAARLAQLRRASLRFEYVVRREGDGVALVEGHTVHACVGPGGKPTGLPAAVVRLLSAEPA
ncbi:MAG: acyl-CoA thioesterase [Myxococcaceae bacterium]|jgi:acyl-CoA thioester hydrolase|nr:acyl-CoA thioesterase [Myxococcaceae bacterium]MCA3016459.1 acyl-CoA thioesterase [Myxococcaceae bacterium]